LTHSAVATRRSKVSDSSVPPSILDIFDAMNALDPDRAASTVTADIEIVLGPHVVHGVDTIREFAVQEDPELDIALAPLSSRDDGDDLLVSARLTPNYS
jgi:hypothetical protein